ncbi:helix-turn-helix domain-containing protein [Ruegeria sp.]|uniref:helix-turn-helix domain-containing protein n=1 Tax=Ruegeria sp. TaxID=1879320 RepID=UPI003B006ED3
MQGEPMPEDTRSPDELRAMFGANLRRLARNYPSISALCRELGINRTQFNRYLAGESFPRADVLDRICRFFDVDARIVLTPLDDIPDANTHHVNATLTQFLGSGAQATHDCTFPPGFYAATDTRTSIVLHAKRLPQCTLIRGFTPRSVMPGSPSMAREVRGIASCSGDYVYMLISGRNGQNSRVYVVSKKDTLWQGTSYTRPDKDDARPVTLTRLGQDATDALGAARKLIKAHRPD